MCGISPYSPRPLQPGLLARLEGKLDRSSGPGACHRWTGASSTSGRRSVDYPHLTEQGAGGPFWRVCRLVLLLEELPEEAFEQGEASLRRWLHDADWARRDLEAAHTCDHSWCVNPAHLEWKAHGEQVAEQAARRAAQEAARWD